MRKAQQCLCVLKASRKFALRTVISENKASEKLWPVNDNKGPVAWNENTSIHHLYSNIVIPIN